MRQIGVPVEKPSKTPPKSAPRSFLTVVPVTFYRSGDCIQAVFDSKHFELHLYQFYATQASIDYTAQSFPVTFSKGSELKFFQMNFLP